LGTRGNGHPVEWEKRREVHERKGSEKEKLGDHLCPEKKWGGLQLRGGGGELESTRGGGVGGGLKGNSYSKCGGESPSQKKRGTAKKGKAKRKGGRELGWKVRNRVPCN